MYIGQSEKQRRKKMINGDALAQMMAHDIDASGE